MKVTIEFDVRHDSDDKNRMHLFIQAPSMHNLIWDFAHNVKRRMDCRIDQLTPEQAEGYEKAMEDFFRMAADEKVDLE